MKQALQSLLTQAVTAAAAHAGFELPAGFAVQIERARQSGHGDFACNAALGLARATRMNPRALAGHIIAALPASALLERAEIAGPGFINLFVTRAAWHALVGAIRTAGPAYGHRTTGAGNPVMIEFVSANPTGPLHVGHGRGAAYGDALARVLRAAGYVTHSEYYVNDAGRQMDILALSVWLRYLELGGMAVEFPPNAYRGDYVIELARRLEAEAGAGLRSAAGALSGDLPADPEQRLDALITHARKELGEADYRRVFQLACDAEVADIRADLHEFGVDFDCWFSERSLLDGGAIDAAIQRLRNNGHIYVRDAAQWFRSSAFGDEKDRVVIRANGEHTYFAADIAYLMNKAERGFEQLIYVLGADHHGYIARLKAAFEAFGYAPERITILLVQFAILYRSGQKVSMSTRAGEFVTLRELRNEVGRDAARFFYVMRKSAQHMDFDLDLAKSQSSDNPVYYVQYAHARVCSVFRQLEEKGLSAQPAAADLRLLSEPREIELLNELGRFPDVIEAAATAYEPHQIAYYLRELANRFHVYYNAHPFIAVEANLREARLALIDATRQVIANGLALLGVSAPERM